MDLTTVCDRYHSQVGREFNIRGKLCRVRDTDIGQFWEEVVNSDTTCVRQVRDHDTFSTLRLEVSITWDGDGCITPSFVNQCAYAAQRTIRKSIVCNEDSTLCLALWNDGLGNSDKASSCLILIFPNIRLDDDVRMAVQYEFKQLLLRELTVRYLLKLPDCATLCSMVSDVLPTRYLVLSHADSHWKCFMPKGGEEEQQQQDSDHILSDDSIIQFVNPYDNKLVSKSLIPDTLTTGGHKNIVPLVTSPDYQPGTLHERNEEIDFQVDPYSIDSVYNDNNQTKCKDLMSMISPHRYLTLLGTRPIVGAVWNTFGGRTQGMNLIISVLKQVVSVLNEDMVPIHLKNNMLIVRKMYVEWNSNSGPYTVNTIEWLAMEDNERTYRIWKNSRIMTSIGAAVRDRCDRTASDMFYEMKNLTVSYMEISESHCVWYEYAGSRWNAVSRSSIERLFSVVYGYIDTYIELISDNSSLFLEEGENVEAYLNSVRGLKNHLSSQSGRSRTIGFSQSRFVSDGYRFLDMDPNLTCVNNRVIESSFVMGEVIVRLGRPEDYVTKFTDREYPLDFTPDHPTVMEFDDWMWKVYSPTGSVDFINRLFSSGLVSGNPSKCIIFFLGERGDNSKTTIMNTLLACWGQYATPFQFNMLCNINHKSNGPDPQKLSLKGSRYILCSEAEEGNKMRSSAIKPMGGNDYITARGCNSNKMERIPCSWITLIAANSISEVDNPDMATLRRIIIVDHPAIFTKNAPEDRETQDATHHYPVDVKFVQEAPIKHSQSMMFNAVRYFPLWAKHGLETGEGVNEATRRYRYKCNRFAQFVDAFIEVARDLGGEQDVNQTLDVLSMLTLYNSWCEICGYSTRRVSKDFFVARISDELSLLPVEEKWCGVKLKSGAARMGTGFGGGGMGMMVDGERPVPMG